jgi:hypothetical protein
MDLLTLPAVLLIAEIARQIVTDIYPPVTAHSR